MVPFWQLQVQDVLNKVSQEIWWPGFRGWVEGGPFLYSSIHPFSVMGGSYLIVGKDSLHACPSLSHGVNSPGVLCSLSLCPPVFWFFKPHSLPHPLPLFFPLSSLSFHLFFLSFYLSTLFPSTLPVMTDVLLSFLTKAIRPALLLCSWLRWWVWNRGKCGQCSGPTPLRRCRILITRWPLCLYFSVGSELAGRWGVIKLFGFSHSREQSAQDRTASPGGGRQDTD